MQLDGFAVIGNGAIEIILAHARISAIVVSRSERAGLCLKRDRTRVISNGSVDVSPALLFESAVVVLFRRLETLRIRNRESAHQKKRDQKVRCLHNCRLSSSPTHCYVKCFDLNQVLIDEHSIVSDA